MSRLARGAGGALSFRDFIFRSQVIGQYRLFLRELQGIEQRAAADLRAQIRAAFKAGAGERDRAKARGLLADGERQLLFVRTYVGTARKSPAAGSGAAAGAAAPALAPGQPLASDAAEQSWVGTGEAYDVKGRLGTEWPWAREDGGDGPSKG